MIAMIDLGTIIDDKEQLEKIKEIQKELGKLYSDVENIASNSSNSKTSLRSNKNSNSSVSKNYLDHLIDDKLFMEIKRFIFEYLDNPGLFDNITNAEIVALHEFVLLKITQLKEIKNILNIKDEVLPFVNLNNSLELYAKTRKLNTKVQEVLYTKINKEINYIYEQLLFCFSILKRIVREKNIFNI